MATSNNNVSDSFQHLQTKNIPWTPDPGIPGFREKMLRFDEAKESVVRLWYLPPGWGQDVFDGKPDRHYHTTVIERGYHIFGDFPHWEFSSVDDLEGELKIFEKGLFMDRPILTLHGILPSPVSETGSMILYWNSGPGVSIEDEKYASETVGVPFDPAADVPLREFEPCRFVETDALPWQPHPNIPGWKIKPLADPRGGDGSVAIVHIPTDWQPDNGLVLGGSDQRQWLFVLSGDLRVNVSASSGADAPLELGEWDFLDWQSPSALSFATSSASDAGCVALCMGDAIAGH